MTVTKSKIIYTQAEWIKGKYGGSGLGATVYTSNYKKPKGIANQCCIDRCYCGTVDTFAERTCYYTIYLADLRPASHPFIACVIDTTTQNQALDHELHHVKVVKEVAARFNPYVATKYPTIKTNSYSNESQAKSAVEMVAILSDSDFGVEFLNRIDKKPQTQRALIIWTELRQPAPKMASGLFQAIPAIDLPFSRRFQATLQLLTSKATKANQIAIRTMKNNFINYFILFQIAITIHVHADFELPIDASELNSFLENASAGKLDLTGRDGCYALPRNFTIFETEEIKYLKIEQNTISLIRSPSDSNGFVLADYTSFDKIIDSTRLGELMSLIVLPNGCDYWKILTSSGSLLFKEQKSSHSESVRIRFCTIKNSKLCFFWILFTTKMTDQSVDNANKPLGDGGPLAVKVECIDISDTGEKVSIESKARRFSPEK